MASLKNVGPTPTAASSLATRKKTDDVITGLVSPTTMQGKIDTAVAPYALKTYVDSQDGLLTTKTYVDTQDALYVPNSWKATANGVAENVSSAIPTTRFPTVPTMPSILSHTFRNTDFASIGAIGYGTGDFPILNTTIPLSTNGQTVRFMCFGNFEGWAMAAAAPANNLYGKPVFKVFINNFLMGTSACRNGNNSASSSMCSITPVGDDLAHTPGHGWVETTATIKVTITSAFADTAVSYAPTASTILSVFLVYT